ncbi:MAG: nucleotidyltransferase family protein, partial [Anaerolineaceae bacterium]|nr:nucleotidyltransferase family protein [Anaerolineaceae bacterium]
GLPVVQVFNADWEQGQSASIKSALWHLPDEIGAVVFLLADQPQVTQEVIKAVVSFHNQTLDEIVAPEIDGQRANPVLFDRDTFPELMKLEGDVGGRAIFARHRVTLVPWDDSKLLLDVDTRQDYQRLLELE